MEYSSLYDLIKLIEYGTKLHVGVCYFGKGYNEKLELPSEHTIHSAPVCNELKNRRGEFQKCFRCRNLALRKAVNTRKSFGGLCINGVYEYTRPIVIGDEVAYVLFIGNILDDGKGRKKLEKKLGERIGLMETLEEDFPEEKCRAAADMIECYIKLLVEKYPKTFDGRKNAGLIKNITAYIEANLEYDIDILHVAQMFHYNERYLGRLFKTEMNKSFGDFLNERRLERARQLLKNSDDTVLYISNRVGFNNVTYFNRLFKRTYGLTPTEYRGKQP